MPEEIIGIWEWDEPTSDDQWYEHRVVPALRARQEALRQRQRIGRCGQDEHDEHVHDGHKDDEDEVGGTRASTVDDVLSAALGRSGRYSVSSV